MSNRAPLMASSSLAAPVSTQAVNLIHWSLPSGAPALRRNLCTLAQPVLTQVQHTPRFVFHDATVLLVLAGRLDLNDGIQQLNVHAQTSLVLVEAGTCADLLKTPGGSEKQFRSFFLTLSATFLEAVQRDRLAAGPGHDRSEPYRQLLLDEDLQSTFLTVLSSVAVKRVSDERLQYRLMDFLWALAERGHVFKNTSQNGTAARLRTLISEEPARHWTAHEAGRALAMSEATLRRRLAGESTRFEELLIDIRMHHAMMLLQTTSWTIPRIALACGYQSRARFTDRFRTRFGYPPSVVR